MGQINSTSLPEAVTGSEPKYTPAKITTESNQPVVATDTSELHHETQFARLNAILRAQNANATTPRNQVVQVSRVVRDGTYEINPLQVSQSIVADALVYAGGRSGAPSLNAA